MKAKLFFTLSLITLMLTTACDKNATTKQKENFETSKDQWVHLRQLNGSSYEYQTSSGSWTGYGQITTIGVENNQVISRSCFAYQTNQETLNKDTLGYYAETKDEIGKHNFGAIPATIDELYETCMKDYLLVDKKKNTIYFEASENGSIQLCGFVPEGCMDDCFEGFKIDTLRWVK